MEMTLGSKGLELGDIATWFSAAMSLVAVLAALYLARRSERVRRVEDRELALALSDAFTDELRALHYRLEKMISLANSGEQLADRYEDFRKSVRALITPVFDAHSQSIRYYETQDAKSIYRAYGNVLRTRQNLERELLPFTDGRVTLPMVTKLFANSPSVLEPVRIRVKDAVLAAWKYTDHADRNPFGPSLPGSDGGA